MQSITFCEVCQLWVLDDESSIASCTKIASEPTNVANVYRYQSAAFDKFCVDVIEKMVIDGEAILAVSALSHKLQTYENSEKCARFVFPSCKANHCLKSMLRKRYGHELIFMHPRVKCSEVVVGLRLLLSVLKMPETELEQLMEDVGNAGEETGCKTEMETVESSADWPPELREELKQTESFESGQLELKYQPEPELERLVNSHLSSMSTLMKDDTDIYDSDCDEQQLVLIDTCEPLAMSCSVQPDSASGGADELCCTPLAMAIVQTTNQIDSESADCSKLVETVEPVDVSKSVDGRRCVCHILPTAAAVTGQVVPFSWKTWRTLHRFAMSWKHTDAIEQSVAEDLITVAATESRDDIGFHSRCYTDFTSDRRLKSALDRLGVHVPPGDLLVSDDGWPEISKRKLQGKLRAKQHSCTVCEGRFQSGMCLKLHAKTHSAKSYTCKLCGKTGFTEYTHNEHMRVHSLIKPFTCEFCGKQFRYDRNVKGHIARVHSTYKPYICQYCDKGYVEPGLLRAHVAQHIGFKPHRCDRCPKSFANKDRLRNHIRSHTKPYVCHICPKRFSVITILKTHVERHSRPRTYKRRRVSSNLKTKGIRISIS